jgi:hypothetical protein
MLEDLQEEIVAEINKKYLGETSESKETRHATSPF